MSVDQVLSSEGFIDFKVGSDTYQIYYILFGELSTKSRRPLIILHGGPGVPHDYLLSFTDLNKKYNIPVIFFDQLGAGKSTHLPDKDGDFWTMQIFEDQVDTVIHHFGIGDDFDLLGQSWGGMLAAWYAGDRQPAGMKHLVLANTLARDVDWVAASMQLLERPDFPKSLRDIINNHELGIDPNLEDYNKATDAYLQRYCCRVDPWPEEVTRAFEANDKEPSQSNIMNGPYVIRCTGTLDGWSVIHLLSNIRVATLVTNGKWDQAQDFVVKPFLDLIPHSEWVKFEDSSHMPHWEEREKCMEVVNEFLNR